VRVNLTVKVFVWPGLMENIRATPGVQFVVLNHPRDVHAGFCPFAETNFNAHTGENLRGFEFSFDGVELINSATFLNTLIDFSEPGLLGVFTGQVIASLIAVGIGFVLYRRLVADDPLFPTIGELLRGIVRPNLPLWPSARFGLSIAFDKNLVSLYNLAPILLLAQFVPEDEVGQFRVALSFMAIPAVLLTPISRLLMVDLPRLRVTAPERVRPAFVRLTLLSAGVSAALAVSFAAVSWLAIPLLYGAEYRGAAPLTLALLLDAATLGLGIAAGPIFRTYDRTDLPIRTSIAILFVGLPATYVLAGSAGTFGAALAYGAMILASRLVSYVQCLRIIPAVAR